MKKVLVISGGSIKGISSLGVVQYLYSKGYINDIDIYLGVSSGSIISFLLCLGYTPIDILSNLIQIDIFSEVNDIMFNIDKILDILQNMGVYDASSISNHLIPLMKDKGIKGDVTLEELYKITGKTFISTVSNISTSSTEYMSRYNVPDMPCLDAIKMSISLPVVFRPVKYNGNYYVDGGLSNNFPIDYLDDGKHKIIGIYSSRKPENLDIRHTTTTAIVTYGELVNKCYDYAINFFKLSLTCMELPVIELTKTRIQNTSKNCRIIQVDIPLFSLPLKKPTVEDIMTYFNMGVNKAKMEIENSGPSKVELIFEED